MGIHDDPGEKRTRLAQADEIASTLVMHRIEELRGITDQFWGQLQGWNVILCQEKLLKS